jgi:hypothetical protein
MQPTILPATISPPFIDHSTYVRAQSLSLTMIVDENSDLYVSLRTSWRSSSAEYRHNFQANYQSFCSYSIHYINLLEHLSLTV